LSFSKLSASFWIHSSLSFC